MMHIRLVSPLVLLCLGFAASVEEASPNAVSHDDPDHKTIHLDSDLDYEKRLYDFGLGKRAYSYVSEYKRLPVYNFGLGKRAPRYDFGLGKRSEFEGAEQDDYDEGQYLDDEESIPELDLYEDDDMQGVDKRQQGKLYSFGLGKRTSRYEFGLGKRAGRYDFGLGKKSQAAQRFNFGLGKRNNKLYSFGLGKRPSSQSRFNFGLGKRYDSNDYYPQENGIYKREIPEDENNSAETDFVHVSTNAHDHNNETAEVVDSHEVMGHSDRSLSHLAKRSVHPYDFGLGKRSNYQNTPNNKFSRQFRRPLYNFGLGKRRLYDFGLGKRSY